MVSFTLSAAALAAILPLVSSQTARVSPAYNHDFEFELPIPPIKAPLTTYTNPDTGTEVDFYEVKISQFTANLFPDLGDATLIGYDGMTPGPTFKVKKGRETVVRFVNEYYRPSSIHLHGSYSRAPFDGWAADTIQPGQYKDYYYPNKQSARTLWYHDHAQDITAINAYSGQAGFYILEDDALEEQLDLPRGDYDIPLMIQSRFYTAQGNISDISAETTSAYGDTFSVNGQILPHLKVEPRKYRFRMLNAAASRSFNYTLTADGSTTLIPLVVVGSDAGFMSKPVSTTSLVQAMAERWEVVIDFSSYAGKNLTLSSSTLSTVFVDTAYTGTGSVMQFRVGSTVSSEAGNGALPSSLISLDLPTDHTTIDQAFTFGRTGTEWTINGRTFADPANRIIRNVPRGVTEKWTLRGGNGWSHPVHIHLVDFQIVARQQTTAGARTGRNFVTEYEAAALKDVATVGAGEIVTVLAKYAPFDGVYMFHCHNLVHEDHDMMAAFNVTALPDFGYPEKTRFLDPMQAEFRAKEYTGSDLNTLEDEILPAFAELEAYENIEDLNDALDNYHATRTPALVGSFVSSTSVAAAAATAA